VFADVHDDGSAGLIASDRQGGSMIRFRRNAVAGAAATAAVVGAVLAPASAQALGQYDPGTSGVDISYPSCTAPTPTDAQFGIVGVSGGRVYTDNACAKAEADALAYTGDVSIYVNTGLVTTGNFFSEALKYGGCGKDKSCGAYYYGYLAGVHAYDYAKSQGLEGSATWWLDVETTNTWNSKTDLNDQSILGEHQAIADLTPATATAPRAEIGVYARPGQWSKITGGGLKSHVWPVWYATGLQNQTPEQLAAYCTPTSSFTSGAVYTVQWIGPGTLNDRDYGC
jgi:hypothetical protein